LEKIEQKDLKNYAIQQEKIKMNEQRKKMNMNNQEEREALKIKIQKIINNEEDNNFEEDYNDEKIKKLINEGKNNNE
jgi:hypothetical protein